MRLTRFLRALALVVAIVAPLGTNSATAQVKGPLTRQGVLEGAQYRIAVPARWNGGLVIFAHGYDGEGPGPGALWTEPLATYLAEQGYAWAASGYRSRGYRPDSFIADSLALRDLFLREVGRPRWTIIHGQSMGGHVAIASLELHPGVYQGALIECGIIDGIGMIDLFLAYRAAAEYLSGVDLTVPVLAIHETGDARVPFAVQQNYRRKTLAAGTADLLVQRAVRWPGHCVFDGEVREQAFDDLVAWIERGVKPASDDVLTTDMATLGRRWTPAPHPEDSPGR